MSPILSTKISVTVAVVVVVVVVVVVISEEWINFT